jgi:hypothetical protein
LGAGEKCPLTRLWRRGLRGLGLGGPIGGRCRRRHAESPRCLQLPRRFGILASMAFHSPLHGQR